MALAFTNLSWWLWSGKHQKPSISNASSLNARPDSDLRESDTLKFPLFQEANVASSSRRVKRKWHSREERKFDKEYDAVLVPSDGGCFSGSESDDSDYSIGWLEPHGPEFQSDEDSDNSFAVLVTCYGRAQEKLFENSKNSKFGAIVNIQDGYSDDMEERVTNMLKIIENDGDSFAERAEMYYRKRPELIGHVEDSYRSYRALAERYNLLSREMQSANRTIAAVFPEQVQYEVDDYDDNEANNPASTSSDDAKKPCNVSKRKVPEVPPMPKKEFKNQSSLLLKRAQLNRTSSTAKAAAPPCSGLSQEEAIEEIDKIQKEILALQTERELELSAYKMSFGIGNVIDDDEARTLMAATALKSCQETLVKLQEKQEQSAQEAKVESRRVKEMIKKFSNLQGEFHSDETNLRVPTVEKETESENIDQPDTELLRKKIKKELEADSNSSLTVMQLAGRIDELVDKVVSIETAVSSQHALINVLRSEADGLQENIKTLEEEKISWKIRRS
ncbi:hypothetical protein GH714_026459 [Hevea brasiliensis]|uniref:NAB domain-containing protein n=1 Tax=Hevea brasiliensis TaxID=3981 RepID=A0A6A6MGU9_HEVBR|nr:hypothetical protein GH714_026459 [Hevea brasiliensis]